MKIKRNQKGFTLIEVVLVLAIGGLIFLLAFLAFQQVSVNRRDSQRRSDAARIIAEISNAEGDGFSLTSATLANFNTTYLGGIKGPGDTAYNLVWKNDTAAAAEGTGANKDFTIYVAKGFKCGATSNTLATSSANVAIIADLEKGFACRDDE